MPGRIQQLDPTRLAVAIFTAASLGLSAGMLRFGVVAAGNRQGSVYVTDRWAGRTYICEPLGCRLILPAGGEASESTGHSGSVSSTGAGRIDQVEPASTVQKPDQQRIPTSTAPSPTRTDALKPWDDDPLVLPQLDSKRAALTSVMPGQGWVPVLATEFLVTDPSGQKFTVAAPSVADKNFVINLVRYEITILSPEIRSRLRPVEPGKTNKDWQVTPLHP
jgi:hypothetical protein